MVGNGDVHRLRQLGTTYLAGRRRAGPGAICAAVRQDRVTAGGAAAVLADNGDLLTAELLVVKNRRPRLVIGAARVLTGARGANALPE